MDTVSAILIIIGIILMGFEAFKRVNPYIHYGWTGATLVAIGALLIVRVDLLLQVKK